MRLTCSGYARDLNGYPAPSNLGGTLGNSDACSSRALWLEAAQARPHFVNRAILDSVVLLTMTNLELLLQRGPQDGDVIGGLDEIRRTVLLDGVPANSDGTVSENAISHTSIVPCH